MGVGSNVAVSVPLWGVRPAADGVCAIDGTGAVTNGVTVSDTFGGAFLKATNPTQ